MSDEVFNRYSAYYDLLYRDKDYVAEAKYVGDSLRSATPGLRSLLELGSGTGRHGRLLAKQGLSVFGVERSDFMVELARDSKEETTPGSFDCKLGDVRTVELRRQFDAVISLFHVVSYLTSNSDVLQTFTTAAKHLDSGGVFFFDVWHGPAVLTERPSVRVKRVENDVTKLTRIAEPELNARANLVTVRYTVFAESKVSVALTTFQEEHLMRYYFPLEIQLLAQMTGFRVERSEEFLTGGSVSERTWGVAYLLRKI
jgi:SAM-dependent methyltransferase